MTRWDELAALEQACIFALIRRIPGVSVPRPLRSPENMERP
jgi:hypothetical protein